MLQSLKLGAVSAPATQVASILTALNTSFFQNAQAFLGVPANPTSRTSCTAASGVAPAARRRRRRDGERRQAPLYPLSSSRSYDVAASSSASTRLYNIIRLEDERPPRPDRGEAFASSTDQFPGNPFESAIGVSTDANVPFYSSSTRADPETTWPRRSRLCADNDFDLNLNDEFLGTNGVTIVNAGEQHLSGDVGYNVSFGRRATRSMRESAVCVVDERRRIMICLARRGSRRRVLVRGAEQHAGRFGARL